MKVLGLACVALASGCLEMDEPPTSETSMSSFVLLGNIYQNGTLVSFDDVTNITGIDMTKIVGLTACDPLALYAVTQSGSSFSIMFSNTSGQSWSPTNLAGKGKEIACDHGLLATLDASKNLWFAKTQNDGNLDGWYSASSNDTQVDRIQGGDGMFYGVKDVDSGYDVYILSNKSLGAASCADDASGNPTTCTLAWPATKRVNIGAWQVTGTGTILTGTADLPWTALTALPWARRAFALEVNGTISTNSKLLADSNINTWTAMNTGSERYQTLTAATPSLLYAIQLRDGVNHINRIRIDETTCDDGIDNDSNGFTDAEDTRCAKTLAAQWCNTHPDGDYCADRYQPQFQQFLDQANQHTSLVHCSTGPYSLRIATIKPGVCMRNLFGTGLDYIKTEEMLTPPDPPDMARYCNVQWTDGTWGFSFEGDDPCEDLKATKVAPATIVRAGLYSKAAANHAFAMCAGNVRVGPYGSNGIAPLVATRDGAAGKTNCIFHVSAAAYPLFSRMWSDSHEVPDRTASPFVHNKVPVSLAQFGFGEPGAPSSNPSCAHTTGTGWVNRFGNDYKCGRETAYDTALDEGRPLYAPANGIVVLNGSRIRDITGNTGGMGSPNQQELYVKYSLGSEADYRESWVVYYAHVRIRLVADGQTVKAGQILGYVGATGATGGFGHLHVGVFRLSNTNAHTPPAQGWHVDFMPNTASGGTNTGATNTVDPLGWANGSAFDPWAYAEWSVGNGAWSPNLFKVGAAFQYP